MSSVPEHTPRLRSAVGMMLCGAALTAWLGLSPAVAGAATPSLVVTPTAVSATGPTTVTVRGSDYLVPPHAEGTNVAGGVYVLFGWVASNVAWGPSARNAVDSNGQFGVTYSYPGEGGSGETRDDGSGSNRFVSFTNGGVSGSSTAFHMDAKGNWSTTITIAGPVYQWTDPGTGRTATVDCRVVQCGIYTFGAHGREPHQ
ncbi:MAG: hypothetical protein R2698_07990 [Microthrixaceae bacterium]